MAVDLNVPTEFEFIANVNRFYRAMLPLAGDAGIGLGGQLLYAGELDCEARALLVAANIAGAASLAATADPAAQRQAIRDGVADFLVTSLDEALRILKNELRKRQPVAVCVALAPEAAEREMLERGVRPDLLPPAGPHAEASPFESHGARRLEPGGNAECPALLTWSVAQAPAQWLPRLDAIALDCLPADAGWPRRWLRNAPRYLGRMAHGLRLLICDPDSADRFVEEVRLRTLGGEIAVAVKFGLSVGDASETFRCFNA